MIKRILGNWHRYVLWTLLSGIFWAWILLLATDAPASKKVQLFAELPAMQSEPLELALEREKPDGIRFVQAAPFDYAMFNADEVLHGDLYVIPEWKAETYLPSFAEIDPSLFPGQTFYESEGKPYGIVVHDPASGLSIGNAYLTYFTDERCILFFNRDSQHLGAWNNSPDDAAIAVARNFLSLGQEDVK